MDFDRGFYLTEDIEMAKKWASNKGTAQINQYELDTDSLNIARLKPNDTWLDKQPPHTRDFSHELGGFSLA